MYKLALIIGGVLLLAGVATAGTFAGLGSNGTQPTISATNPPAAAQADVRREDRRADRRAERPTVLTTTTTEARGRANEAGEDVRGREAEPNDDRGARREAEPNDDNGADNAADDSNSGPSSSSGASDDSGHSGHGSDGHGGGDD